jgi:hypothetical protein
MKSAIATTVAAALLAVSSFAFAADNKNNNNENSVGKGNETTGSIMDKSGTDTPDQADIDRCKTAQADDPTCVGVPKQ